MISTPRPMLNSANSGIERACKTCKRYHFALPKENDQFCKLHNNLTYKTDYYIGFILVYATIYIVMLIIIQYAMS